MKSRSVTHAARLLQSSSGWFFARLAPLNLDETVPLVNVTRQNDDVDHLKVRLRIDAPTDAEYYRHGACSTSCCVNSRRRKLTATRATSSSPGQVRLTLEDLAERRSLVGVQVRVGVGVGDASSAGVIVV
jgi:hypothetical protein